MALRGATLGVGIGVALGIVLLLGGCGHVSDQAIVDNCRAGGGLTLKACECVRSEMKTAMDAYSYGAMVLLANGKDVEAGGRLDGLTERDRVAVAGKMMSAYTLCADGSVEAGK